MGVETKNASSRLIPESKTRFAKAFSKLHSTKNLTCVFFGVFATLLTTFDLFQDNSVSYNLYSNQVVNWSYRQDSVKEAFLKSWDAYSKHAWGKFVTTRTSFMKLAL
jgi:hypothetical protein